MDRAAGARRRGRSAAVAALSLLLAPAALAQPAPTEPPAIGPKVDAPGRLPAPPPSAPDLAYDARVLSSAAAAESFQGPLDGGWTLAAQGDGGLYALQLVDTGDKLEGAWRDLRRTVDPTGRSSGDPAGSGVLELVQRAPPGLVIRFTPQGQAPVTVALGTNLSGQAEQAGRKTAVSLRRGAP